MRDEGDYQFFFQQKKMSPFYAEGDKSKKGGVKKKGWGQIFDVDTSSDVMNLSDVFSVSPHVRALLGSKNTSLRFLCQT